MEYKKENPNKEVVKKLIAVTFATRRSDIIKNEHWLVNIHF